MGGAGTYFLGSKHADIWSAIAPVAPAAFSMTENRAEILPVITISQEYIYDFFDAHAK